MIRQLLLVSTMVALIATPASTIATAQTSGTSEDEARALYERARELMNDNRLQSASDLFEIVADEHGGTRYAAEALYWRAFALYREGGRRSLRAAKASLERQLQEYPDAARRGDSRELAIRIQTELASQGDAEAAEEIARLADRLQMNGESSESEDLEMETKLAALNALMQMSPEHAIPILRKSLIEKPQSYPREFREQALFLMAQHAEGDDLKVFLQVAQTDPDPEVRAAAVFWLSQTESEEATELLLGLLRDPEQDPEIREKAIFSLSQIGGARASEALRETALDTTSPVELRDQAIFWLHQLDNEQSAQFLRQLYAQLDDEALKEKTIFSIAQIGDRESRDWLMERAMDPTEDIDLRKNALFWASQSGGVDAGEAQRLYETVDDREMREQVIFVLSQMRGREAADALMQIARSEDDPELRQNAIFWLGQLDDDRAAELLLEIIEGEEEPR
jgi:HEAT repeat protein